MGLFGIFSFIFNIGYYYVICYIIYLVYSFIYFLYTSFIRKRLDFKQRYGEKTWVLVTGATDGIGKGVCEEFAKEGFNILLASRNEEKLNQVANELRNINKDISTDVIIFDFNYNTSQEDYNKAFLEKIIKYDISVLVNNVGWTEINFFNKSDINNLTAQVNINIIPQAILTKMLLTKLYNRKLRSAIVDISSFGSGNPAAGFALYCATKRYGNYLTRALNQENGDKIDFLSVKPLFVKTPLINNIESDGFTVITVEKCVKSALNHLGYDLETFGHWVHKIQGFLLNWIFTKGILRYLSKRSSLSLIQKIKKRK